MLGVILQKIKVLQCFKRVISALNYYIGGVWLAGQVTMHHVL